MVVKHNAFCITGMLLLQYHSGVELLFGVLLLLLMLDNCCYIEYNGVFC